jgi:hypothetical protein
MTRAVTITGTRSTAQDLETYAAFFAAYLGPFAGDDAHFYIGGARGIDSLSLLWLAGRATSRITVVVPGTLDQQPADARQAIARSRTRIAEVVELRAAELGTPAYHARNRWMVDRSSMTIGFPLADQTPEGSSGTWQTLTYAATQAKPRLIVPV